MRWLIRILSICLFVALVFIAIAFMAANPEPHQLKFLDWQFLDSSVGVIVLLAFSLGAVIGLLAGAPLILGLRRQTKKMQKRLAEKQALDTDAS